VVSGRPSQRRISRPSSKAIAEIIERPMTAGHLGEWIAAQIFDIALEPSTAAP
jgi:hypothetical protein